MSTNNNNTPPSYTLLSVCSLLVLCSATALLFRLALCMLCLPLWFLLLLRTRFTSSPASTLSRSISHRNSRHHSIFTHSFIHSFSVSIAVIVSIICHPYCTRTFCHIHRHLRSNQSINQSINHVVRPSITAIIHDDLCSSKIRPPIEAQLLARICSVFVTTNADGRCCFAIIKIAEPEQSSSAAPAIKFRNISAIMVLLVTKPHAQFKASTSLPLPWTSPQTSKICPCEIGLCRLDLFAHHG
jgi:hypothetical protein